MNTHKSDVFKGFELVEDFGVYDGEGRTEEETHEVIAGETFVLPPRVGAFEFRHTDVVRKEAATELGGFDTFVTQFAQEATVSLVDSRRYRSEIVDRIVHGVSVDMVDLEARWDGTDKGDILDISKVFMSMPTVEFQIPCGILSKFFERNNLQ